MSYSYDQEKGVFIMKRFFNRPLIFRSDVMKDVFEKIKMLSENSLHIFLTGETGTGKDVTALMIHYLSDQGKRFKKVDCGAVYHHLAESEFFGHCKGAFTGAENKKGYLEDIGDGTIYLDEIGNTGLDFQKKLLSVFGDRKFMRVGECTPTKTEARFIVATNSDLREKISRGEFREDLFYRINNAQIHLPSLNERREDIPVLIKSYVDFFNSKYSRTVKLSEKSLDELCNHDFPGNVRQLEKLIEYAISMTPEEEFSTFKDVPLFHIRRESEKKTRDIQENHCVIQQETPENQTRDDLNQILSSNGILSLEYLKTLDGALENGTISLKEIKKEAGSAAEKYVLERLLNKHFWNRTEVARNVGISYRTILNKLFELRIVFPDSP